ncbi:heme oxygenase, partial [Abortiporus biennis]
IDLSLPISTLLKTGTAAAHEKAEHSQGAGWLTRGELDREEYVRFLMMLYHVYDTLERALDKHAANSVLQPTYNPSLLARTPSISSDIAYLLQTPESSWQSHPIHVELQSSPPGPFAAYKSRLQELADSQDPSPLLAHAYVRYLGDLSGGQFIRRRLAKSYNLEDGSGLSFYDFRQLGGTGSSTMGDMKKIKDWYREGMDAGVGDNDDAKAALLEEANVAFELNSGLFTTLRPPTGSASVSPAQPPLGEPTTPPNEEETSVAESKVVFDADASASEGSYSIAGVVAFIAAISLAHFILVVGKVTGSQGY